MEPPFRLDLFDASTYPTRRDEAWKYTDFKRALDKPPPWAPPSTTNVVGGPFKSIIVDDTTFVNGRSTFDNVSNALTSTGIGAISGLRWVSNTDNTGWQASLGLTVRSQDNGGWGDCGVLLESYEGEASNYAANALLNIVVQKGASLTRVVIAEDAADAVTVSTTRVRVGAGGMFRQLIFASGAKLQRFETHVDVEGEDAKVELNGIYMCGDGRHADLTSVITHAAPGSQTRQLIKGVAAKGGRGVFQGKIVVERAAQQTDARQHHQGMLLEPGAEIFAKPELMIFADDVQCAHGNTAGGLDDAAKFYMRSRGVPENQARALLIEAFLIEALSEGLPGDVDAEIRARVASWLEAHL